MKKLAILVLFALFFFEVFPQNYIQLAVRAQKAGKDNNHLQAAYLYKTAGLQSGDYYLLGKAIENYFAQNAPDSALALIRQLPDRQRFMWLARYYAIKNSPDSALAYLDKALTINPDFSEYEIKNDPYLKNIKSSRQWLDFWKNHQNSVSRTLDQVALKTELKQNLDALNQLQSGNFPENSVRYHLLLGDNYFALKDYKNAAKEYQTALKYSGDKFDILLKLAMVFQKQDNCDQALIYLQQAYKLRPYELPLTTKIANCYKKLSQYDKALQWYDSYLQYDSSSSVIYQIARAYYDQGNYTMAIRKANEVLKQDQSKYEFFTLRGESYFQTGLYKQAYKDLSMSLDLNPFQSDVYYYLGLSAIYIKHKQEGCSYLSKAYQMFGNKQALQARERYCKHIKQ